MLQQVELNRTSSHLLVYVYPSKTRKAQNSAESNHVLEMPPHHHSEGENQELWLTIRKGSSQARKRLLHPDPTLGLLTARRFSRRKGGKKEAGEERMQNGIIMSLAKMKLTHWEDRGIYMHNFTWIKSLCQICDALW